MTGNLFGRRNRCVVVRHLGEGRSALLCLNARRSYSRCLKMSTSKAIQISLGASVWLDLRLTRFGRAEKSSCGCSRVWSGSCEVSVKFKCSHPGRMYLALEIGQVEPRPLCLPPSPRLTLLSSFRLCRYCLGVWLSRLTPCCLQYIIVPCLRYHNNNIVIITINHCPSRYC
jgi:hypothetical protein